MYSVRSHLPHHHPVQKENNILPISLYDKTLNTHSRLTLNWTETGKKMKIEIKNLIFVFECHVFEDLLYFYTTHTLMLRFIFRLFL